MLFWCESHLTAKTGFKVEKNLDTESSLGDSRLKSLNLNN